MIKISHFNGLYFLLCLSTAEARVRMEVGRSRGASAFPYSFIVPNATVRANVNVSVCSLVVRHWPYHTKPPPGQREACGDLQRDIGQDASFLRAYDDRHSDRSPR